MKAMTLLVRAELARTPESRHCAISGLVSSSAAEMFKPTAEVDF
jgi:hypothetical protein